MPEKYNWNIKARTDHYEIMIDSAAQYGYFEHLMLGEDRAGGLWFDGKEIVDFDGVSELPKEVTGFLKENGYSGDSLNDEDQLQSPKIG